MQDRVGPKLAALAAAIADLRELSFASMSAAELLDVCAGVQEARNLIPTIEHPAVAALAEQTTPARIGAKSWPEAPAHPITDLRRGGPPPLPRRGESRAAGVGDR
ncbi:hypothetical protein M2272_000055 [Mycobacterium frederiksbergense]|uniref:DUF222 domain-containing protein n=1 Tax=Mycolicibacterium frederiksbergense TaxID=117567 RepID=A0ABT6KRR7_9MYCO|nr:hypothetical protein [Mycolicibacterium frederiksbergense]MDH6193434.1 hypothetical protein [Mycolicibacterium frederiksbergense]